MPFKNGVSGNPSGRPKKPFVYSDTLRDFANKTEEELMKMYVSKLTMIQRVVRQDLLDSIAAENNNRIRASEMIQDRLEGKPQQSVYSETKDITDNPIVQSLREMIQADVIKSKTKRPADTTAE